MTGEESVLLEIARLDDEDGSAEDAGDVRTEVQVRPEWDRHDLTRPPADRGGNRNRAADLELADLPEPRRPGDGGGTDQLAEALRRVRDQRRLAVDLEVHRPDVDVALEVVVAQRIQNPVQGLEVEDGVDGGTGHRADPTAFGRPSALRRGIFEYEYLG